MLVAYESPGIQTAALDYTVSEFQDAYAIPVADAKKAQWLCSSESSSLRIRPEGFLWPAVLPRYGPSKIGNVLVAARYERGAAER
jgi:hypothetical protein